MGHQNSLPNHTFSTLRSNREEAAAVKYSAIAFLKSVSETESSLCQPNHFSHSQIFNIISFMKKSAVEA
jgi:hypothetical protein